MRSTSRSRMIVANPAEVGIGWRRETSQGRSSSPARGTRSPEAKPTMVAEKRSAYPTRPSGARRSPHRHARIE